MPDSWCGGYHGEKLIRAKYCAVSAQYGCKHFCGMHVKALSGRRYYDIHLLSECANGQHDCGNARQPSKEYGAHGDTKQCSDTLPSNMKE